MQGIFQKILLGPSLGSRGLGQRANSKTYRNKLQVLPSFLISQKESQEKKADVKARRFMIRRSGTMRSRRGAWGSGSGKKQAASSPPIGSRGKGG
jgi:hypothetical protein